MYPALLTRFLKFLVASLIILGVGCRGNDTIVTNIPGELQNETSVGKRATEAQVILLQLGGAINQPEAEISGLAWFGDVLILLPQYPGRFDSPADGSLFGIPKVELLEAVRSPEEVVLTPLQIPFEDGGLSKSIPGFEGFEAIAFLDSQMYLTVESSPGGKMEAHLVNGSIEADLSGARIENEVNFELPVQTVSPNKSYESLLVYDRAIFAIYEVNGEGINTNPRVYRFTGAMNEPIHYPFPVIEFRVTDASDPDAAGVFWVINYFFPGDVDLSTGSDALAERYGIGESQAGSDIRERLVALQISQGEIRFADQAPIYLELMEDTARNWEGLARLDELGFLLVTDKFPSTMLGFVSFP